MRREKRGRVLEREREVGDRGGGEKTKITKVPIGEMLGTTVSRIGIDDVKGDVNFSFGIPVLPSIYVVYYGLRL